MAWEDGVYTFGEGADGDDLVHLGEVASSAANLLKDARTEFEDSLRVVQRVIESIEWENMRTDTLIDEIGTVTFENYKSVKDLLDAIVFTPLKQQELLETDIQKSKKHVFISPSLDAAEEAVIKITGSAGEGEFKNLTGVYLTDAKRNALLAGQEASDQRDHNDLLSLVSRYTSPNTFANQNWLTEQYSRKREDRERNVFSTLFEMAQENVQWAFKNGIAIELLHENFTSRYNRLFLDLTSANIAAYKAEVQANISELEASLAEIDSIMQVEQLKYDAESAEWALKIDQANSRMNAYITEYAGKLSRNLKMVNTRMVGGKNVADGYKTIYSAYAAQYSGVSLSNSGGGEDED